MDYAKAFDTVPHKRRLYKLQAYGIKGQLLEWIKSFLKNRKQRVVMGDFVSFWAWVFSGVPQGSVLAALLFIIYINDLLEMLKNTGKLFADDTKKIAKVKNQEDCISMQNDINTMVEWSKTWLMSLNDSKCKIMHLGKMNPNNEYQITSTTDTQTTMSTTKCEKDLGVFISDDLKWQQHVNYACNKANRTMGMLRNTFSHFNPRMVEKLYKVYVRPHVEYGASVWCPNQKDDIKKLERVQHRATRLCPQLRAIDYDERLITLNLSTLETRRRRVDIILLYKLLKSDNEINWLNVETLTVANHHNTRGHNMKINNELVKNCTSRYNFYTNRVTKLWNSLSQ